MQITLYQVDAFTKRVFGGNPAAVCPLEAWLDDATMQAIAAENNLAETAFFVRNGNDYDLRWFTPTVEVPLCGHATLASGYVVLQFLETQRERVTFHSKSGPLHVVRDGNRLQLDFPALHSKPCPPPTGLAEALGAQPTAVLRAANYLVVLDSATTVRNLKPDIHQLGKLDANTIVTARGDDCDFVSRFFAPLSGIPEDPVTGSAHCALTPYWADRLGKTSLFARQVSARGGELWCELHGDRVRMSGHAVLYMQGHIELRPPGSR